MSGSLEGKTVIVTGNGRSVGRAVARGRGDGLPRARLRLRVGGEGAAVEAETKVKRDLGSVDIWMNNAHDRSVAGMTAPVETAEPTQIVAQIQLGRLAPLALMQGLPVQYEGAGRPHHQHVCRRRRRKDAGVSALCDGD